MTTVQKEPNSNRVCPGCAVTKTGRTILLVEDNEALGDLLASVLQQEGYEPIIAHDGHTAMQFVETGCLDLIVTDLCLPRTDGIELLLKLGSSPHKIPVIAMSGGIHGRTECFLKAARLLGARHTLAKPFAVSELVAAVREALTVDTLRSRAEPVSGTRLADKGGTAEMAAHVR